MDNFLPFSSSSNAYSNSMNDPNHNNFTTFPSYDHNHMLPSYPNVACPMMMNPPDHPEAYPQIPVRPTRSGFGSVAYRPRFRGGFNDPLMSKMARINRKNAMIRSRNNPSPNSAANEMAEIRRQMLLKMKNIAQAAARKDLYRYCTFDNKMLRILLEKHLKNSDVAALGRIVLPKKDAEGYLPELLTKEGLRLEMRDADSTNTWTFRYKYWCNNRSRMYVLENTGEFVKKNGVEMGDYLTILEDESKNLYYSIRKSDDKQGEGEKEDETMELEGINLSEEIDFDFMPSAEEGPIDYLNNQDPIQDDFMNLAAEFDLENPPHQDQSSFPPADHLTDPGHIGSSSDHMSFDDFPW